MPHTINIHIKDTVLKTVAPSQREGEKCASFFDNFDTSETESCCVVVERCGKNTLIKKVILLQMNSRFYLYELHLSITELQHPTILNTFINCWITTVFSRKPFATYCTSFSSPVHHYSPPSFLHMDTYHQHLST